jgi:hypothetical protein
MPTSQLKLLTLGESMRVGAIPLPVNAIAVGEFVALLIIETLPVTLPAATGELTSLPEDRWQPWRSLLTTRHRSGHTLREIEGPSSS